MVRRLSLAACTLIAASAYRTPLAVGEANNQEPLDAASDCAESVREAARHFLKWADDDGYYLPGDYETADCKEAQVIAAKHNAVRLGNVISAVVIELDALIRQNDHLGTLQRTAALPETLRQAAKGRLAGTKRMLTAYRALGTHIDDMSHARDKRHVAALEIKEKGKQPSALFFTLSLRVATHDLAAAKSARDYAAFTKKLPVIAAAASDLSRTPQADVTSDYLDAVWALHAAASAVTASWQEDKVTAFEEAHTRMLQESSDL